MQGRSSSSVTLKWRDRSSVEEETLLRRRRDGVNGWEEVFTYGPVSDYHTMIDEGLDPDQRYCYQFVTSNAHGSSFSHQTCAYTKGIQTAPVVRAQLRLKIADKENSETDNVIFVRLNSPGNAFTIPALNETIINYGRKEFVRGDDFTYDLNLSFLERPADVTLLSIGKNGSDGMCIDEVELIVNAVTVFERVFGSDNCEWLDDREDSHSNMLTFFHEELRSHPSWSEPPVPLQLIIPRSEIESRIQSIVGHMIASIDKVEWDDLRGENWVEASRLSDRALGVDLDLEAIVPFSPNPSIDVDFILNVGFLRRDGEWRFEMFVSNVESSTDYNWFVDTVGFLLPCGPIASIATGEGIPDCVTAFENYIDQQVLSGFQPIALSFAINDPCSPLDFDLKQLLREMPIFNLDAVKMIRL